MVKIIDGEIVPDDDPRLTSARSPNRPRTEAAAGGSAAGGREHTSGSLFDWSAPPVRVVPEPPGTGISGLPGLQIYGAHVRSTHLLLLLAAGLMLGLKGLLVGGVIWYVWAGNQRQAAAAQASATAQQQRRVQDFVSSFMAQQPLGTRSVGEDEASGRGPAASSAGRQDDGWQGKGKAYKLSG